MLRIEPAKVRLLDDTTLARYGLTETDPIEKETEDLECFDLARVLCAGLDLRLKAEFPYAGAS
jgi:hypothetical protein